MHGYAYSLAMGINVFPKMRMYLGMHGISIKSHVQEGIACTVSRRAAGGRPHLSDVDHACRSDGEKKELYFCPAHFSSASVGIDGS